ncbi:MAG: DAK2 domain-containing protein [Acidobacteriota bacterium]|nr:DAK2 domain-containing protein [Acidobacteriota bacterium]MDE3093174.1 DAK2 domain-containing protein [Acidobacteriota bacterium]MDE3139935.1 DAK2 domain-containing protein [Acidobacteriota bacterium]MDE3147305.1 DAK2 domain-containing protein [Acidobacteriota bacterium]
MTSLTTLSAADLSRAVTTYAGLLRAQRDVINRLNVYPVPDGDTGTNMTLTLESVVADVNALGTELTMSAVCRAIAQGSLMGARGNSGVILSQMLRGLIQGFSDDPVDATQLAAGLVRADLLARQAVARPVEGTILSVARAAAEGARDSTSLESVVHAARDAARVALARTPDQLAVLKQAGVVDSGGTGLVLWFDALCHVVSGDPLPTTPDLDSLGLPALHEAADYEESGLRYEVMFLLDAPDDEMTAFRRAWDALGDSIVIVGGEGLYNCHIHSNDVGAAIEAALDVGRPRQIRVSDLSEQVIEERWVREANVLPEAPVTPVPTTAVVAVVVGDGVGRIFTTLGVRRLVVGGQSMNPSTAELVEAVRATGSTQVVILPNNRNIRAVAEQVDALVDADVRVVPTDSIVEGFAALLSYDPDESAEENFKSMSLSAQHVVAGEVTRAVRDAQTEAGDVARGDWIGLGAGGVLAIAPSLAQVNAALLGRLVRDEHELLTVIEGEGASDEVTAELRSFVTAHFPRLGVEVHHGGQPLYPYFFGVE